MFNWWGQGRIRDDEEDDSDNSSIEEEEEECYSERSDEYDAQRRADYWLREPEQRKIIKANLKKSTVVGDKMVELMGEAEEKGVGSFAISEQVGDAPFTTIKMKDGTIIRYPLEDRDLEMLIPKFETSPFGRGDKTIVDTTVRNSWQLNPSDFEITNKKWDKFITDTVTSKIAERFGISDPFVAKPHKLLLYKTGSFFKPHRDSEKEDGMFGTLVVQLPSIYTGGQLLVRHDGSKKMFDHSTKDDDGEEFMTFYSAFYCDCEHEVLPLTSGVRMCLVYNLVMKKRKSSTPKPVSAAGKEAFKKVFKEWRFNNNGERETDELMNEDERWSRSEDDKNGPPHHSPRLIYLLSHQYSYQSLTLQNLKGTDKVIANFLLEMGDDCEIIAFLGIMERTISCNTDWEQFLTYLNGKPSSEVKDPRILLMDKDFARILPTSPLDFDKVVFEDREVIPKSRLEKLEANDTQANNTGNEGTEITLQYKTACIVIFPSENIFFHCLESLDDSTAEKMFLDKLDKYKSSEEEKELITACGKAFLNRRNKLAESYDDLEKWLKIFLELGDKELLSYFAKAYWNVINSNLETFISTFLVNRSNSLWNHLFVELNAEFKKKVEDFTFCTELKKKIPTSLFSSLLQMIMNTKDETVVSTFMQGYGALLLTRVDEVFPLVIGTGDIIGKKFLRMELIKLFENSEKASTHDNKITWGSSLDLINTIDDENKHLLSSFLTVCSWPIQAYIDKFLPTFVQSTTKLDERFLISELTRIFHSSSTISHCSGEELEIALRHLIPLKDAQLMMNFISLYLPSIGRSLYNTKQVIQTILSMDGSFGWKMVSDELMKIIKKLDSWNQMDIVKETVKWCPKGRQDVIQSCREFVNFIFEKSESSDEYRFKDLGEVAPKLGLDVIPFLEDKDIPFVGKLLKEVALRNDKKLDQTWLKVGIHWFKKMAESVKTVIAEPEWKIRNDFTPCSKGKECKYCPRIQVFMKDAHRTEMLYNIPNNEFERGGGHEYFMELEDVRIKIRGCSVTIKKKRRSSYLKQVSEQEDAKLYLPQLKKLLGSNGVN